MSVLPVLICRFNGSPIHITTGLFTTLNGSKMLHGKVRTKKKQGPFKDDEQERGKEDLPQEVLRLVIIIESVIAQGWTD